MSDDDCVVCDDDALLLSDVKNEHNGYDRLQLIRPVFGSDSRKKQQEQREEELIRTMLLMLDPPREKR
jgi:hypothetical protein